MSAVLVTAEIGINHNGDVWQALDLIDLAKRCGCDAVKFQKRTVDVVYPPAVQAAPRVSRWGPTTGDQKRGLEFAQRDYEQIDAYCRDAGIGWYASAWDVESVHFLEAFRPPYHKIASPLLTHLSVLKAVAALGRHTFVSTGMSTEEEVDRAVELFRCFGCPITLLHCVSIYPCPEPFLNLARIQTLQERYGLPVGYSGHEVSPIPTILAIGAGAVAVERHLTLDRASEGSDQAASLERRGMEMVVAAARAWEVADGDGTTCVRPAEAANARKLRYWEAPATEVSSPV